MSYKHCCDDFMFAVSHGSDPVLYACEGEWRIVYDNWVAKHCPFCGSKLKPPPQSGDANG
jgi:hypothetical protein